MPWFPDFTITDQGLTYKSAAADGEKDFVISKVTIGDGTLPVGKLLHTVTDLYHARTDMPVTIQDSSQIPPATLKIKTALNSASLAADIQMREAGVWAKNPDNSEILYAYAYAGDEGERAKPAGSSFLYEETWEISLVTGRFENVTVTVENSLTYATAIQHLDSFLNVGRHTLKQAQEQSRLKHKLFGG